MENSKLGYKIVVPATLQKVLEPIHAQGKKIVLVGGCFDILHAGHVLFLEKAKARGDTLFLLLESDGYITKTKGNGRPINVQQNRALVLAALSMVDVVVRLPDDTNDAFYDALVLHIKPAIIATTADDPNRHHKERQAKHVGAAVLGVTERLSEHSTSTVVARLEEIYE